jgi:hypothetical protein
MNASHGAASWEEREKSCGGQRWEEQRRSRQASAIVRVLAAKIK